MIPLLDVWGDSTLQLAVTANSTRRLLDLFGTPPTVIMLTPRLTGIIVAHGYGRRRADRGDGKAAGIKTDNTHTEQSGNELTHPGGVAQRCLRGQRCVLAGKTDCHSGNAGVGELRPGGTRQITLQMLQGDRPADDPTATSPAAPDNSTFGRGDAGLGWNFERPRGKIPTQADQGAPPSQATSTE